MITLSRPLPRSLPQFPTWRAIVSSGWSRPRPHHKSGPDIHRAMDLPAPAGTPIYAMADGVVSRFNPTDNGDAGIWLAITHGQGVVARMMHMSKIESLPVGTKVRRGQQLGLVGATGDAQGNHLHVDLSVPESMLAEIGRLAGVPKGEWSAKDFQSPYGWKIPAEPWIPVDGFSDRTVADAKAAGVRLAPVSVLGGSGSGGLLLAAGAALAFAMAVR